MITKNDRPVGVFLSMQDLEDTIWAERALKAHEEGYHGAEESDAFLKGLIAAES
jgi:hypothetical protein